MASGGPVVHGGRAAHRTRGRVAACGKRKDVGIPARGFLQILSQDTSGAIGAKASVDVQRSEGSGWLPVTTSYTAVEADRGRPIRVAFGVLQDVFGGTGSYGFDNVVLSAE